MVINNNKNKNQLFKITDISKAFSEGNVMKQFETEVKLFFEDIDILERKKNYYSLQSKNGNSEKSPVLYKSRNSMDLYYDLLDGKFYLSIAGSYKNPVENSLTTVLVGSETFEGFIKKYYDYKNKFIVYSSDNDHRNYNTRKQYPRIFEVVDMDTILELLNNLFEKQYSKNLKNFLLYESEYDMKFSANNNRRVFPFFLGNNLGYKLSKFEENYNVFCENYKLKEEFSFLNNLYKLFQQKIIDEFHNGEFGLQFAQNELKKAGTSIENEIGALAERLYQDDCEDFEKGRIQINESRLIKFALTETRYYSEMERRCLLHTEGFFWSKVFKEVGTRISMFLTKYQDVREWYLDILGEPHIKNYDEFINELFVKKFLVNEYSANKKYNIDLTAVLIDVDEYSGKNVDYYFEAISKLLNNKTSIQLNVFHFIGTALYSLFSGEYQSRKLFEYLFSLTEEQKKRIILKKSELLVLKTLCENNLATSPVEFDFFKEVDQFTVI